MASLCRGTGYAAEIYIYIYIGVESALEDVISAHMHAL